MHIKTIAASVILAFAVASVADAQRTSVAAKVASERLPSSVTIANVPSEGKTEIWGAGTIVDARGYVLTCNHVRSPLCTALKLLLLRGAADA